MPGICQDHILGDEKVIHRVERQQIIFRMVDDKIATINIVRNIGAFYGYRSLAMQF